MLKNYLIIAWRNLLKNRLYSVINIGGLAVGLAVSFLLLLYVYNEFSFDKFNGNSDRLYMVFRNQPGNGQIKTKPITPEPLAAVLKKDFPEIESVVRISTPENILISYKDKGIKVNTIAADSTLPELFTFDFTSFSIWIFLFTRLISLAICLVAVSWQAIKAASVNPVNSLRSE